MASVKLGFTGRVAVITGAGGGLGREYALEFARRGASVVVNDLGGSFRGVGKSNNLADKVVNEIISEGGKAVANYDSVEEGEKIIDTAIKSFGKVDILVNNAGILRDRSFQNMSDGDWDKVFQVHVKGAFKVTKAAWPHMRKQRYGRIIMTTSPAGLYGNFGQSNYSAAKMALHGLCKTLSIEGKKNNIFVNTIAPLALTRMTEDIMPGVDMHPRHVAPFVVFLCHESCKETGSLVEAAGGYACKTRLQRSRGGQLRKFIADFPDVECVAAAWDRLTDFSFPSIVEDNNKAASVIVDTMRDIPAKPLPPNASDVEIMTSHRIADMPFMYTSEDVIRYALSIGAGLPHDCMFLYEGHNDFSVLPSFASCMGQNNVFKGLVGENPLFQKLDVRRIVHGEHYIELLKPIPTSGAFISRARVVDCIDKRKFVQVIIESEVMDQNKEMICRNQFIVLFLGSGGIGRRGRSEFQVPALPPPNRAPDMVVEEKTGINQAAFYRLNGDPNPLHIDKDFANMTGFDEPILHGLCTYGYGVRHVLKTYANNDVKLFKSVKGQFSKPVIPGQTLVTEMWGEGKRVHFQVKVKENGNVVVKGAYVDFHKDVKDAINKASTGPQPTNASINTTPSSNLKADELFSRVSTSVSANPDLVKSVKGSFLFQITDNDKIAGQYLLDFNSSPPSINKVSGTPKADVTVKISDDNLIQLADGNLNPMSAFFQGKIKASGKIGLAQKLDTVFKAGKQKLESSSQPSPSPSQQPTKSALKSDAFFTQLRDVVSGNPGLVKNVKGSILFQILLNDKIAGEYLLDFTSSSPNISTVSGTPKADVTVKVSDENFLQLAEGRLNPMSAFMQGKIKVSGNIALAQKLDTVFKAGKQKLSDGSQSKPTVTATNADAGSDPTLKASQIFNEIKVKFASNIDAVKNVKGTFLFKITRAQKLAGEWLLNFNQSPPVISAGAGSADVTITIDDKDFEALATGKLNSMQAFMQGKLKAKGKIMLAQKLGDVFKNYAAKL